jgi:hypothetical protein
MSRLLRSFIGRRPGASPSPETRRSRPQLEILEDRAVPSAAPLDLTTPGAQGFVGGALFQQANRLPAHTGPVGSFVRLQVHHPATVEQGYNTDARPLQFDENADPLLTHALRLSDVPVVVIDGVTYRQFVLEVNQTRSSPLLSLDELRLYASDAANLTGYDGNQLAGLNPLYNLDAGGDHWILLDNRLSRGGIDMTANIPEILFTGVDPNSYVYLYSKFGLNEKADGAFEEWGVALNGVSAASPPPAPSSLSGSVTSSIGGGIQGVQITLTGVDAAGNKITLVTQTDQNGNFAFANLAPGTYTLTETPPGGLPPSAETLGTLGGAIGVDQFTNIVVPSGSNGTGYNFGQIFVGS